MLTFKQWLLRQYGTANLNITPKIVSNSSSTTQAKIRSINS
jgi:hypothetical protein